MEPKSKESYRDVLTPMQFKVAFEHGTEPPFQNEFHNSKKEGIYVSIASEEVLFSSKDKFDSGTGWPSFSKPIDGAPVKETTDNKHGMSRTEVSCSTDTIHLGHVFNDGPKAGGGNRYCINSASLKFIEKGDMTSEDKAKYGFN